SKIPTTPCRLTGWQRKPLVLHSGSARLLNRWFIPWTTSPRAQERLPKLWALSTELPFRPIFWHLTPEWKQHEPVNSARALQLWPERCVPWRSEARRPPRKSRRLSKTPSEPSKIGRAHV